MKYIFIAYFLGNTYAKNYRNRTVYVKWNVFLRHGV